MTVTGYGTSNIFLCDLVIELNYCLQVTTGISACDLPRVKAVWTCVVALRCTIYIFQPYRSCDVLGFAISKSDHTLDPYARLLTLSKESRAKIVFWECHKTWSLNFCFALSRSPSKVWCHIVFRSLTVPCVYAYVVTLLSACPVDPNAKTLSIVPNGKILYKI